MIVSVFFYHESQIHYSTMCDISDQARSLSTIQYEWKRDNSNRLGSMGTRTVLQVTEGKENNSRNGAHGCQDSLFGIDRV